MHKVINIVGLTILFMIMTTSAQAQGMDNALFGTFGYFDSDYEYANRKARYGINRFENPEFNRKYPENKAIRRPDPQPITKTIKNAGKAVVRGTKKVIDFVTPARDEEPVEPKFVESKKIEIAPPVVPAAPVIDLPKAPIIDSPAALPEEGTSFKPTEEKKAEAAPAAEAPLAKPTEETLKAIEAAQEKSSGPVLVYGNNIRWTVPEETSRVRIRVQSSNGTLINEYIISDYISLHPGQRLQVIAE